MDAKRKIETGQKLWGDGLQELFDETLEAYEAVITELQAKNEILYTLCLELTKQCADVDADAIVERVLERTAGSR